MTDKQFRYGSLFSGIEAASQAWENLGWKPAWFSEIADFPSQVLATRYPAVPNHGDMTKLRDWRETPDSPVIPGKLQGQDRELDLLVGGSPCQSYSVAGLRGGIDDPRGNLALEFNRLALELQPLWLLWENVPGVLSSNGGKDFESILNGFQEAGYALEADILDAQFFGLAQRRRRVFVLGHNIAKGRQSGSLPFVAYTLKFLAELVSNRLSQFLGKGPTIHDEGLRQRQRLFAVGTAQQWANLCHDWYRAVGVPAPEADQGWSGFVTDSTEPGEDGPGLVRLCHTFLSACHDAYPLIHKYRSYWTPETAGINTLKEICDARRQIDDQVPEPVDGVYRWGDFAASAQAYSQAVGDLGNRPLAGEVLPVSQGLSGDSDPGSTPGEEAAAAPDGGAGAGSGADQLGGVGTGRGTSTGNGGDIVRGGNVVPEVCSNAEGSPGLPFLTLSNIGKNVNNQTPLIAGPVLVFDPQQITHPDNRSRVEPDLPCPTLNTHGQPPCVSYSAETASCLPGHHPRDDADTAGNQIAYCPEVSPTLVSGGQTPASHGKKSGTDREALVVVDCAETYPTLRASNHRDNSNAASHAQMLITCETVSLRGRDGGATAELGGEQAGALRAAQGGGSAAYVLAPENGALSVHATQTPIVGREISPCLSKEAQIGVQPGPRLAVRRLTPTECERLMGMIDGWTAIDVKSGKKGKVKPATDSNRYKAIGNSMAVNVMAWIGSRVNDLPVKKGPKLYRAKEVIVTLNGVEVPQAAFGRNAEETAE